MPRAWERQTREGARSYSCFQKFLDLGPDRTLKQTAAESGVPEQKVRSLSAQWNWRERALAWEDYLAEQTRKATLKILEKDSEKWARRRVKLREDEFTTAERLLERANKILDLPLLETSTTTETRIVKGEAVPVAITIIKPIRTSQRDAGSLARDASHLLRMSAEMETSRDRTDLNLMNDNEKIEAAQRAIEKIRDEIMASLQISNPDMVADVMKQLPGWVGAQFKVPPEALTLTTQSSVVSENPQEDAIDGEIVEDEIEEQPLLEMMEEYPYGDDVDIDATGEGRKES